MPSVLGIFSFYALVIRQGFYRCTILDSIASSLFSLPQGLAVVTAHILGEQTVVGTPVREPPVEMRVRGLLSLDPFDNMVYSPALHFTYDVPAVFCTCFSLRLCFSSTQKKSSWSRLIL